MLIAFDLKSTKERDLFYKNARSLGLLCNPTTLRTIRIRPNLAVTEKEVNLFLEIVKKNLNFIKKISL